MGCAICGEPIPRHVRIQACERCRRDVHEDCYEQDRGFCPACVVVIGRRIAAEEAANDFENAAATIAAASRALAVATADDAPGADWVDIDWDEDDDADDGDGQFPFAPYR